MQCHLNVECKDFKRTTLESKGEKKLHTFYKDNEVYMLFKSKNFYTKLSMDLETYNQNRHTIEKHISIEYALYLLALVLESFLFALYALRPLKKHCN